MRPPLLDLFHTHTYAHMTKHTQSRLPYYDHKWIHILFCLCVYVFAFVCTFFSCFSPFAQSVHQTLHILVKKLTVSSIAFNRAQWLLTLFSLSRSLIFFTLHTVVIVFEYSLVHCQKNNSHPSTHEHFIRQRRLPLRWKKHVEILANVDTKQSQSFFMYWTFCGIHIFTNNGPNGYASTFDECVQRNGNFFLLVWLQLLLNFSFERWNRRMIKNGNYRFGFSLSRSTWHFHALVDILN